MQKEIILLENKYNDNRVLLERQERGYCLKVEFDDGWLADYPVIYNTIQANKEGQWKVGYNYPYKIEDKHKRFIGANSKAIQKLIELKNEELELRKEQNLIY